MPGPPNCGHTAKTITGSEAYLVTDCVHYRRGTRLSQGDRVESSDSLEAIVAPSGWSIAQLLNHLTYDDEVFWSGAILGGDHECIGLIQDGWKVPVNSGADAVAHDRRWVRRSDAVLAEVDLDAPPRWWPPTEVFPFPPFADARDCVFRLLMETATHAGQLDIVRERIDGHQHLVVA